MRTGSLGTFRNGPLGAGPSLSPLPWPIGEAGRPIAMIVILKCKQNAANKLAFAPSPVIYLKSLFLTFGGWRLIAGHRKVLG